MWLKCTYTDFYQNNLKITKGKYYKVISKDKTENNLYWIVDDNGETHRYSIDFFKVVDKNEIREKKLKRIIK
ncbi:MAG: hypothetical protein M0R46_11640 [Candidatus Muirbacterium halophilum]|nr:hypothetical protein [Candidatus Muirbacterium halophilum]